MKPEWKYLMPTPPLAKAVEAIDDYAAQAHQALATGASSNANVPSTIDGWTERLESFTATAMANNRTFASLGASGGQAYQETEYARQLDYALVTAGASVALELQDGVVRKNPMNKAELVRYGALALALRAAEGAHFAFGNPNPDKAPSFN